jgi:hypothetical protein
MSRNGLYKAYRQLGSQITDAVVAQRRACAAVTSKDACLAVPPPALAAGSVAAEVPGSSSFARGLGCDFYGDKSTQAPSCRPGYEFAVELFSNVDTQVDQ